MPRKISTQLLRQYANQFPPDVPGVISFFSEGAHAQFPFSQYSEEAAKTLLIYAALFQEVSEKNLCLLVVSIYKAYPESFFSLTDIEYSQLTAKIQTLSSGFKWALVKKVPGILRSVTDFFRKNPSFHSWLSCSNSIEYLVDELSDNIFFMGKNSQQKFKARYFIYLLMICQPEILKNQWAVDGMLPLTRGAHNLLFFLAQRGQKISLKDNFQLKFQAYNSLVKDVFPGESFRIFNSIRCFKINSGPGQSLCEKILGGCKNCIFQNECH